MANPFVPDMTMDWRPAPVVSPSYPQQRTLPTWGAIGTPDHPTAAWNPNTPAAVARKLAGFGGLGGLGEVPKFYSNPAVQTLAYVLWAAGTGIGWYHGYKRNRGSLWWGFVWSVGGALAPILIIPVAFAQGLGKPAKR